MKQTNLVPSSVVIMLVMFVQFTISYTIYANHVELTSLFESADNYTQIVGIHSEEYQGEIHESSMEQLNPTDITVTDTLSKISEISALSAMETLIGVPFNQATQNSTLDASDDMPPSNDVVDIDLGFYQSEMLVGSTQLLNPTIISESSESQNIIFSSSDPTVASVNMLGVVSAVSVGGASISVTSGQITRNFMIYVFDDTPAYVDVIDIDLGDYQREMTVGSTQLLIPTPLPMDATNEDIVFSSSNAYVASINMMGRIVALSVGETVISVSSGGITRDFVLRVLDDYNSDVKVENIDLGDYQNEMYIGSTQLLMPAFFPIDAPAKDVTFRSTNASVASISVFGRITALRAGETTISVHVDGIRESFNLRIVDKPTVVDIDLGDYENEMYIGKTQLIMPTVLPADVENQRLTFNSSNSEVASINLMGRIVALEVGRTEISVSVGEITRRFTLNVIQEPIIKVEDIDLGDYEQEMFPRDAQVLMTTVLPLDAKQQSVVYNSSAPDIATINAMGRITAIRPGTTMISVSADGIVREFLLTVIEKTVVDVIDIDLGDYPVEMHIGANNLLMATVLPTDAAAQNLVYSSTNTEVATVNAMGRITALTVGETEIGLTVGGIMRTFILSVVENPSDIRVSDIEVSNFRNEITIEEVLEITATALPRNAKEPEVSFSSSNPEVATINTSGRITGISVGTTDIIMEADGFRKSLRLTVKASTDNLEVDRSFLVLRIGDSFKINAKVHPPEADQTITYQSLDTNIASVSDDGVVTAKALGSVALLVSAWDTSRSVIVIVNDAGLGADTQLERDGDFSESVIYDEIDLIEKIRLIDENVEISIDNNEFLVNGDNLSVIHTELLNTLNSTNKKLTIKHEKYQISIIGSEIRNVDNEFLTIIDFLEIDNGIEFIINDGRNLPGRVYLNISDRNNLRYVYLLNESRNTYEYVDALMSDGVFALDNGGKYLILENRLSFHAADWALVIGIIVAIGLVGGSAYIFVKKKHWFW